MKLRVQDGQDLSKKASLSEWDPYSIPILTEKAGRIQAEDIKEGVTATEQHDEVTGLTRKNDYRLSFIDS
jgi:DNA-directed RNA polymerase subunit beta'